MEGSTQFFVSGTALIAAFVIYEIGKTLVANSQQGVDKGISNTWGNDPIIQSRKARAQMQGITYPTCEVWDETYQLFLGTGDKESDQNSDTCFTKNTGKKTRYLADAKTTVWSAGDQLQDDPSEAGTCYFKFPGDKEWSSFFNVEGVVNAPNRSSRLCFAAGETMQMAGQVFQKKDGSLILAPDRSVGDNLKLPRCEVWGHVDTTNVDLPVQGQPTYGWMSADSGQLDNDVQGCTSASAAYGATRQVTADWIYFKNPNTGAIEQVQNVAY